MVAPQATPTAPSAVGDEPQWLRIGGGGAAHLVSRSKHGGWRSPCGKIAVTPGQLDASETAPACRRCIQLVNHAAAVAEACHGCADPRCFDCNRPDERRMFGWLSRFYSGDRYVIARHVPDAPGFAGSRIADAVAMDMWNSHGLQIHGHEIKVSRADWKVELRDPLKWTAVGQYCDRWWLAIPDLDIVRGGELPEQWGLLLVSSTVVHVVKKAPRLEPRPVTREFMAAFARAAAKSAAVVY